MITRHDLKEQQSMISVPALSILLRQFLDHRWHHRRRAGWHCVERVKGVHHTTVIQTLCYSKCVNMLKHSIRLLLHYLKFGDVPVPT